MTVTSVYLDAVKEWAETGRSPQILFEAVPRLILEISELKAALQKYEGIAAEIRELLPTPDGGFTNEGFYLHRYVRRWRKALPSL
jgi:hypothetical protein